jgi:hypothetical protein
MPCRTGLISPEVLQHIILGRNKRSVSFNAESNNRGLSPIIKLSIVQLFHSQLRIVIAIHPRHFCRASFSYASTQSVSRL